MSAKDKTLRGEKVRISSTVVVDAAMLERARLKAAEHGVPFPEYLERAMRLYGKFLDKKITVIARPI
ncbi:MAG: hypothetical protein V1806_10085 [Pseudomonadota bacterium]